MADVGFSDYLRAQVLTDYVVGSCQAQVHTGLPGPNGTSNLAGNGLDGKEPVTMGAVAGDLTSSNTTVVEWGPASSDVTITHATLWDATGTNCLYRGQLADPQNVQTGGYMRFPIGQLVADNI